MSTALDKPLWNRIKNKIYRESIGGKAGTWNARKAQLAVKEYKKAGGKYPKKKDPNNYVKNYLQLRKRKKINVKKMQPKRI